MSTAFEAGPARSIQSPGSVFAGEWGPAALALLAALAAVAVAAWAFTVWMGAGMSSAMLLASTTTLGGFGLFLGVWSVMMVAMMFPAAAPMAQAYVGLTGRETDSRSSKSSRTAGFLATYIAVWTGFGVVVAIAYVLLAPELSVLVGTGTLGVTLAGAVLIAAGVYQTTPLKQSCLRGCRTPVSFLLTQWRSGFTGAFRLGARHAAYCVGCCALLFTVLFAVGLMALPWMALIALLIFVEKLVPARREFRVSAALGAGLAAIGIAFLVLPSVGSWALGLS